MLVLGVHGHAMLLTGREVRDLLPLLERFARTGALTPEQGGVEWEI